MFFKRIAKVFLAFVTLLLVSLPVPSKTIDYSTIPSYNPSAHYPVLADWIVSKNKTLSHAKAMAYVEEAYKASMKYQIDPILILAVINSESTFKEKARNPSGASGLMQVVPRWHRDKIAGRNILDYRVNIDVGAQIIDEYLRASNENFTRALNKYRGAPNSAYRAKIQRAHASMRSAVLAYKLQMDEPIIATYNFNQPRSYTASLNLHTQQTADRHQREFFDRYSARSYAGE